MLGISRSKLFCSYRWARDYAFLCVLLFLLSLLLSFSGLVLLISTTKKEREANSRVGTLFPGREEEYFDFREAAVKWMSWVSPK